MRLWVDTDVGTNPDDAVALLCAAAHPEVELVGVSTVDGDTRRRAEEARDLVDALVVAGADLDPVQPASADALLAIGPLTNVAHVLAVGALPATVAIMGGALAPVTHRGARVTVEHNLRRDPGAARAVIHGRDRLLLCPLDVTVLTCVDDDVAARVAATDGRLRAAVDGWIGAGRRLCLHDPAALLALLGEPGIEVEARSLRVDGKGHVRVDTGGVNHRVVTKLDAPTVVDRIVTILSQLGREIGSSGPG